MLWPNAVAQCCANIQLSFRCTNSFLKVLSVNVDKNILKNNDFNDIYTPSIASNYIDF